MAFRLPTDPCPLPPDIFCLRAMASFETISRHRSFGGWQYFAKHASQVNDCAMRFSVYVPPQAAAMRVPVLYYLAGLTCTEETFMIKAGAQRVAADLGLMLVAPDTSPRGLGLPGEADSWDFGVGAGFYLDATLEPWAAHFRMYSYVTRELPSIVEEAFPADPARRGIFGHSMGGHGALTIALKHPDRYRSVSAFAPIVAPMRVPWGRKAFTGYLGADESRWRDYDATELVQRLAPDAPKRPLLIDQGLADPFLEVQLQPELLENACRSAGHPLTLRRHEGYDHGYYFIATFVAEHLEHHSKALMET
jgi:S-formylglutathione hydrolase